MCYFCMLFSFFHGIHWNVAFALKGIFERCFSCVFRQCSSVPDKL